MRPETRIAMEMLFAAKWNLPKAAKYCNLTEKEIQSALDELMKDKTTIIIAHRLSTIQNADVIFTLEKGIIESNGDHEYLIKNSAVYKKLQLQEDYNDN